MRVITSIKENAIRASHLVTNRTAKTKKPFTISEELIFPSTKDICRDILGEAAVQKVAHVTMSASTVTRRIEERAEDIDTVVAEDFYTTVVCTPG